MIVALISVYSVDETLYLLARVHFSQEPYLKIPASNGLGAVSSANPSEVGAELRSAERMMSDLDESGRLRRESDLRSPNEMSGLNEAELWRNARQAIVDFRDDGTINIAASKHGKEIGSFVWKEPFYHLSSPDDSELGVAVLEALKQSS